MCGIAGFVNIDGAPADAAVLSAMTDLVRHRGPDDRGTLCVSLRGGLPDTALGFHRLKIVDVSGHGRQRMTSADGSIALLFRRLDGIRDRDSGRNDGKRCALLPEVMTIVGESGPP